MHLRGPRVLPRENQLPAVPHARVSTGVLGWKGARVLGPGSEGLGPQDLRVPQVDAALKRLLDALLVVASQDLAISTGHRHSAQGKGVSQDDNA
eukprot:753962-Rhodomonas_salina.1